MRQERLKSPFEVAQEIDYLSRLSNVPCVDFRHQILGGVTTIPSTALPSVATALDGIDLVLAPGSTYAYATFARSPAAPFPAREGLQVFDVTDPTAPVYVGTGIDPSGDYTAFDLFYPSSGDILYLHTPTAFQTWDISMRSAPVRLSQFGDFAGGIFVVGTRAYTCNTFPDRMAIFDVSNPAAIVRLKSQRTDLFPTPIISPTSCWVVGTNMFMINSSTGDPVYFTTVDVSVPTAPTQTSALLLAPSGDSSIVRTDMLISGTLAYVVWDTKLFIIDITAPAAPVILSTTTVATTAARDLALNGTTLYIAIDSALAKYNVSNPLAPVLISTTSTLSDAFGVALSGSNAIMLDSFNFGAGTGDFIEVLPA